MNPFAWQWSDARGWFAAFCIAFVFLGVKEMQPWDESLYAIRARACVEHGAWLDQTPYAAGELYSAAHPPLGVWCMAAMYAAGGRTAGAMRMPGVLCTVALLGAIFLWLRRRFSEPAAMLGFASLLLAQQVQHYTRQGQLDAFQLLFTGLAALLVLDLASASSRKRVLLLALLLGGAFLSKFLVTGLAVLGWLLAAAMLKRPALARDVALATLLGALLAAPWYLFMWWTHPEYPAHLLAATSIITVQGYSRSSVQAWWYYLNQLLIALPLLPVLALVRFRSVAQRDAFVITTVWALSSLLVLTLSAAKLPHFVLHLALPAALAIGIAAHHPRESPVFRAIGALACAALIVWSSSELLRLSLRAFTLRPGVLPMLAAGAAGMLLLGFILLLGERMRSANRDATRERAQIAAGVLLLLGMFAVSFGRLNAEASEPADGAEAVARELAVRNISRLVILCGDIPYAKYQPQLAWYLDGWNLGQRPGKQAVTIAAKDAPKDFLPTLASAPAGTRTAVIRVHSVDALHASTEEEVAQERMLDSLLEGRTRSVLVTPVYTVYEPVR